MQIEPNKIKFKKYRFLVLLILIVLVFPIFLLLYTMYDNRSYALISMIFVILSMIP